MSDRFVVVGSRLAPMPRTRGPFAAPSGSTGTAAAQVIGITVDVVEPARAADLKKRAGHESIAPSMPLKLIAPVTALAVADPVVQNLTWGVRAVRADTSPFDGTGIVVAVLDTGIDAAHPAFQGVELVEKDFTGEGNGDAIGHGTHCAGTIFGRDVDGVRIGVARGVRKALIGKVIGREGGATENIVSGIQWAVEQGAHVISLSLGIDFVAYEQELRASGIPAQAATSMALAGYRMTIQLFDRLASLVAALAPIHQPSLIIAAAGNESHRNGNPAFEIAASPPAVAEGVVSVAAVGTSPTGLKVAPFSNTGASISAPGVSIVSAKTGGGVESLSGTSMATPHAAGVAALWAQKLESVQMLVPAQFGSRVLASAVTTGFATPFSLESVGGGIVQAPQAEQFGGGSQ